MSSQTSMKAYDRMVLVVGNGTDTPKKGDTVRVEYDGYIFDGSGEANMGDKYVITMVLEY